MAATTIAYGAIVSDNPPGHDDVFFASDDNDSKRASHEGLLPAHLGPSRQYWRDAILGLNDGIISTFLLVVGVSGGRSAHVFRDDDYNSSNNNNNNNNTAPILLSALAGALAGVVSMAAGEYVATKAQNDVLRGELALERRHIAQRPAGEVAELADLLPLIGLGSVGRDVSSVNGLYTDNDDDNDDKACVDRLQQDLRHYYTAHPHALWKLMKVLEFGILDEEVRSPLWAALTAGSLFGIGAMPSVLPYIWCKSPAEGLLGATVFTALALLVVGGVKTWATRGSWVTSALENLLIAGTGGLLAYFVGALFDWLVSQEGAEGSIG